MAKQPNPDMMNKQMIAADAEELFHRNPDLKAFAGMVQALIDARTAAMERMDQLNIAVTLMDGRELDVTVPNLPNPIVSPTDIRLEAFRNIVRIGVAQAPTSYRLRNGMPEETEEPRQVTAS